MDYARKHIKKYWGMAYRRTLGIALITISIVLALGLTFTVLRGALAISNYTDYLVFGLVLAVIGIVTFLSSFMHSHVSTVKYMNEEEHRSHSKYMAVWMISIVVGIVAFLIPLFFVRSYIEPVALLFSFGGFFWVLYATVVLIFKHSYGELAIGGTAFWAMFIFGIFTLNSNTQLPMTALSNFALYFAAMSITVISGFVGLALIINASRESLREFTSTVTEMQDVERRQKARRRKRRK